METLVLDGSKCADGICCFSCVIGERASNKDVPLKLIIEQRIKPNSNPKTPVLINYQLCESCPDLKVNASKSSDSEQLVFNLRCSIYSRRPRPCKEYPIGKRHQGPCLYNEYLAPEEYKNEIHRFDWSMYYGIQNKPDVILEALGEEIAALIPGMLQTNKIRTRKIGKIFRRKEYLLLPVPAAPEVLFASKEHQQITSLKNAFEQWPKELTRRKAETTNKPKG